MAAALPLTNKEAELVKTVLGWWREGIPDAKEATIDDGRTLDTFDKLLDGVDGLDEQDRLLGGIIDRMDEIWKYTDA